MKFFSFIKIIKILFFSLIIIFQPIAIQFIFIGLILFNLSFFLNINNMINYNIISNADFITISLIILRL